MLIGKAIADVTIEARAFGRSLHQLLVNVRGDLEVEIAFTLAEVDLEAA